MEFQANKNLVAACGLYCGTCRGFKAGKCPGCRENQKAERWCKLRGCVHAQGLDSCAECPKYGGEAQKTLKECSKFNNFMGKVFGLIFRSDRFGCIDRIREVGADAFAQEMAESGYYNRPTTKKHR